MSDLAAVRIHSNTTSHLLVLADHLAEALHRRRLVFAADCRADLHEAVEQVGQRRHAAGHVARRVAGNLFGGPEVHELARAVLDIELEAAERLHQLFDVEAFVRARAQVAENAGTQRRLHERAESRFDVGYGRRGAGALGAEGEVVHYGVYVIG